MMARYRPTHNDRSITLVRAMPCLPRKAIPPNVSTAAPEYVLDEVLTTASDMYSLGCLIHAVHLKGEPPFKNFGNLGSVREHAGRSLSGIVRLDKDLQGEALLLILAACIAE